MMKRERAILERAFAAEIDHALNGGIGLIQTRAKIAAKLVADGLLREETVTLGGRFPVTVSGYALTELGRLTYCVSCKDQEASDG